MNNAIILYFLKRVISIVPVFFISLLMTLFIADFSPVNPAQDAINVAMDKGDHEINNNYKQNIYKELNGKYGRNLPIFYFSIYSLAEKDLPKDKYPKEELKKRQKLLLEYGNYFAISTYLDALDKYHSKVAFTKNDSLNQLINILEGQTSHQKITEYFNKIKLLEGENNFALKPLKVAIQSLETKDEFWRNLIPYLYFNGKKNQFHRWIYNLSHFHLGYSFVDKRPVGRILSEMLPNTLILNLLSISLIFLIAIPSGYHLAIHQNTLLDKFITFILSLFYGMPQFWLAGILLTLFSGTDFINIFPVSGMISEDLMDEPNSSIFKVIIDVAWHLVLPITCIVLPGISFLAFQVKNSLLEQETELYFVAARSRGMSRKKTLWKHGLPNTYVTIVTIFSGFLAAIFSGSVIIENIFSIPGLGNKGFIAGQLNDFPVIVSILLLTVVITSLSHIIADILYLLVNPKIDLLR